jgi:hypothetical protein
LVGEKACNAHHDEAEIKENNAYTLGIIGKLETRRDEFYLGDTTRFRYVRAKEGSSVNIRAVKAFMISPFTDSKTIDEAVEFVRDTKQKYDLGKN